MALDPLVVDVREQTSGIYWATLEDDEGNVLPGNVLSTFLLTLYVIKLDASIGIVNARNAQNILNANQVEVFNALQTRADGFTYNVKWSFLPADTTLVEVLPYERHIALFEWTWPRPLPGNGSGKQELVLNVKNLTEVP